MKLTRIAFVLATAGLLSGQALAQTYTSDPAALGAVQRLDFGGAGLDSLGVTLGTAGLASFSVGPFSISNSGTSVLLGEGSAATLGNNGSWQAAAPWSGTSGPPIGAFVNGNLADGNSVTFALNPGQSTSAIGLYWMSDATEGATPGTLRLEIFRANGSLIESIGPGSASTVDSSVVNGRSFHGFNTGAAEIASFRVSGDYHVYGDVVYAQPIPEPKPKTVASARL